MNFFEFLLLKGSPKVSFPGSLSHSERILDRFQLGKSFIIENLFIMKNVNHFLKMVETGVDPCLSC